MSTEPVALRLAVWLEADACDLQTPREAAAELRRLHAQRSADLAAMRMAVEALEYHVAQTRPIARTLEAIAALRARVEG